MKKILASAAALTLVAGMAAAQTATTEAPGGMAGMSGMAGMQGMGGMAGMQGMGGMAGMDGLAGMGGMAGMQGMSGMAGMQGMGGMAGMTGMTATEHGIVPTHFLGSWIMDRNVWTTERPSGSSWDGYANLTERPSEWKNIANIDDVVIDMDGKVTGYVVDIGGFLGMGAKKVMLNPDVLRMMHIGDDTFFATHYTEEELKALPEFNKDTAKN